MTIYLDKRHSISKTFSWLPSPVNATKENRRKTMAPTINTSPSSTTPSLSSLSSSSSTCSPTTATKKFGFFSKFRASMTGLDQIISSDEDDDDDDEEEDEEHGHSIPPTPRDSQQLTMMKSLPEVTIQRHDNVNSYPLPPSSLSPPPLPPQHASLYQHVQDILAFTFRDIDELLEEEWEKERHRLELDLATPAPFQFS